VTARRDVDIPGGAVSSFAFGLWGWITSGIAGLLVFANLLSFGQQEDLTDSAAPTIIGLAVAPVLAIFAGLLTLGIKLRDERLGRSLAWGGVALGFFGLLNLVGYAVQLAAIEEDLAALQAEFEAAQTEFDEQFAQEGPPSSENSSFPPTSPPGFAQVLVTEFPQPGPWNTLDGTDCSYELIDQAGITVDLGNAGVIVVPEGVAAFYSDGCAWSPGTGD
jgi:hypothetical protein